VLKDLVQIRRLGEQKRGENERLRRHLKRHVFVERRLRAIAGEMEAGMDCTGCANCCRSATVRLKERDIPKLAKFLRLKERKFLDLYTEPSEEEGLILKRNPDGSCPFLAGNLCTVYEARPGTCEDFPHLVRGPGSITARMWEMPDRACYCPIVYNTLEAWKEETKFFEKSAAK
jgi:Fe-S-cluster containining protein